MKALVLPAPQPIENRPLVSQELPKPSPGPHQLLVKVHVCGVCRTDLHIVEGDLPLPQLPIIPGHQIVGTVEKTGPGCSQFAPGDLVGIAWLHHTCQECIECRNDQENLCPKALFTGYHVAGGYAEYTLVPEAYAYAIPEGFDLLQAAPLLCAGIIGYRSLKRSRLQPGQTLGIFGFGSSAHVTIQIALYWGCRVLVASREAAHQRLAASMGASWVGPSDVLPEPVDSAIIFAPAGEVVPLALRSLNRGGTAAIAGIHLSPIPPMDYATCLFYEKNLCSVTCNTRTDGEELLQLAQEIPIRSHVTAYPLSAANEVLLKLKRDEISGTAVLTVDNSIDQ